MKIISFLGFVNYTETTYVSYCKNKECITPFFQEALVDFYKPKQLYVLLTKTVEKETPKGASKSNWILLQERLNGKVQIEPIFNIPEKTTPEDIWTIFQEIVNVLEPDDRVIFDITLGFRFLPIVVLLAISYLRVVRNVKIDGLLYGGFDAKTEDNKSPTFDLLPIVSLLDWTTATDQFIKTGDAGNLANLLQHDNLDTTVKLAENIQNIAQGLRLLRPIDVMKESANLSINAREAISAISNTIPPFAALSDRIVTDYGKFGLADPDNAKVSLLKQLSMIEWYVEKQQIVQALSLAREWLPSLLCYHFNLDHLVDRDEMELLLNGGVSKKDKEIIRTSKYLDDWNKIDKLKTKKLKNLWGGAEFNLANLRNDALHAGFRKNPKSASDIIDKTKSIVNELNQIAIDWNLVDEDKNP